MYAFEEFLNRHVILVTKTCSLTGIMIEHAGEGHKAHWLISTTQGTIEIPDKDIMCTVLVRE